jgi:hypothetical protein
MLMSCSAMLKRLRPARKGLTRPKQYLSFLSFAAPCILAALNRCPCRVCC